MTTAEMPRTIQASIHPDALSRVPDFFNATLLQTLNELLQNSRRAGATQIHITASRTQVTIADNGSGIADPATLLAFGLSGWNQDLARSEHPAGMGMYSLARRSRVSVTSRVAGQPAWSVSLNSDTFVGKRTADVVPATDFQQDHGTTISFSLRSDEHGPSHDAANAAEYYPLPVYLNGSLLKSTDFLHEADHIEYYRGVRIGVYRQKPRQRMNFHGTTLSKHSLPTVTSRFESWNVQVDVVDCPDLQLVLPTRHQVVQTPFVSDLRIACRAAIFRAMLASPEPVDVGHSLYTEAASMGVNLPEPKPALSRWRPGSARSAHPYRAKIEPLSQDAILINPSMLPPSDQQVLSRAAGQASVIERLFQTEPALNGFEWYDRLPLVDDVSLHYTVNGVTATIESLRKQLDSDDRTDDLVPPRPNTALALLRATDRAGNATTLGMPTDVLLANEFQEDQDDNQPMVTKDSTISPADLADMIVEAYFHPSDDRDTDSIETQLNRHYEDSLSTANFMLVSPEEARRAAIAGVIQKNLLFLLPPDSVLTVRTVRGKPALIQIEQAQAA